MTITGFTHVGRTVGRLTVIGELGRRTAASGASLRVWACACSCGSFASRLSSQLASHGDMSCGCLRIERLAARNRRHGAAVRGHQTPEYVAWKAMHRRCSATAADEDRRLYHDRGITVAPEWESFAVFLSDMGPKPTADHSIDRKDNERGYSASNCRWATPEQQRRNQRRYLLQHQEYRP